MVTVLLVDGDRVPATGQRAVARPLPGDADQAPAAVDAAVHRFGRLDVVVNSAAVAIFGRLVDVPREVFDAVLSTNVTGSAHIGRSAPSHFRERGNGHLVLVGSVLGQVAVPVPRRPRRSTATPGRAWTAAHAGSDRH